MSFTDDAPLAPFARDWAKADLLVRKVESEKPEETIYEFRKTMVVNGVPHIQFVWINQQQLRGVGIDHGL